jgi:hypothetical protein
MPDGDVGGSCRLLAISILHVNGGSSLPDFTW